MRPPTSILSGAFALVAVLAACSPLKQDLGVLGGLGPPPADSGTGPTPIGTQIPPLVPEWGTCNSKVLRCFQAPALPASPPASGLFANGTADPDPTHKPTMVYPLAGSVHPINLADITFQWLRGTAPGQTVFRIRLRRINGDDFEFYVPCNHANTLGPPVSVQCVYHLPPGAWIDLATTAHGETLSVDVSGVDPAHPGVVATSDSMPISFSPQDVRGGFYYWSTSIQGALRVLFGALTPQHFIAQNSPSNPSLCSGCHTVSRDGSTIAFSQGDDPAAAVLRVEATADPSKALFTPSIKHDSATLALNRQGTRVLVSVGQQLILRDAATGATLGPGPDAFLGAGQHGFHPEWSPDDQNIVITLSGAGDSDWSVSTGSIAVLPYNGGAFGPVEVIVPSGAEFNFYPTWSPDGHWIAFTTAPVAPLQTSYVQTNARLRLANRDTHQVFELTNATWKTGRVSSMPRFAPFSQSGALMFLTFKSKIDYGFFLPNNDGGPPQLWISAIDPMKAQQPGDDPSSPPVWLPFQSVAERNYLGTWSESVGCRVDAGCGAQQICSNGACAMAVP